MHDQRPAGRTRARGRARGCRSLPRLEVAVQEHQRDSRARCVHLTTGALPRSRPSRSVRASRRSCRRPNSAVSRHHEPGLALSDRVDEPRAAVSEVFRRSRRSGRGRRLPRMPSTSSQTRTSTPSNMSRGGARTPVGGTPRRRQFQAARGGRACRSRSSAARRHPHGRRGSMCRATRARSRRRPAGGGTRRDPDGTSHATIPACRSSPADLHDRVAHVREARSPPRPRRASIGDARGASPAGGRRGLGTRSRRRRAARAVAGPGRNRAAGSDENGGARALGGEPGAPQVAEARPGPPT